MTLRIKEDDSADKWVKGRLKDGAIENSNASITLYNPVTNKEGYISFSVNDGYKFYVAAWDSITKQYLGVYRDNGEFASSGNIKYLDEYTRNEYL